MGCLLHRHPLVIFLVLKKGMPGLRATQQVQVLLLPSYPVDAGLGSFFYQLDFQAVALRRLVGVAQRFLLGGSNIRQKIHQSHHTNLINLCFLKIL